MNNFDDLLSDEQLQEMAAEGPTVSIQIPLRETQPLNGAPVEKKQAVLQKKSAIIGRIKTKKRTQQLSALSSGEAPTSPIIRTDQLLPSGLSIHDIYKNAGLGIEGDSGFNVFRVESMLDDTSIVELDERAKEAAVVMALKTHDVELRSVIDDGRDHQLALEAHDVRFQDEIQTKNAQLETENKRLHAEIERYANPRLERMEANQKRLEELQGTYEQWQEKKRHESSRLDKMLNRWTAGNAVAVTAPLAILDKKQKRETEPLPYFEELSESSFLEPVVLMNSELDSEIIRLANAFPETDIMEESSAVFGLDSIQPSEVDLTMETSIKSNLMGDIGYYCWVALSICFWLFGGISLATIVETMQPIAALTLAFIVPIGGAVIMGLLSKKGHGRWFGYIAFLGYFTLIITVIAHVDIDSLATLLTKDPSWLTEASNVNGTQIVLPEFLASGLTSLSNFYGDFLYSTGLASKP